MNFKKWTLFFLLFGLFAQASMPFPQAREYQDVEDVLEYYPTYLAFVVKIGKTFDSKLTHRIAAAFLQLKKQDPESAAKFLKSLRFEIIQKQEIVTGTRSNSSELRVWIHRYLPV